MSALPPPFTLPGMGLPGAIGQTYAQLVEVCRKLPEFGNNSAHFRNYKSSLKAWAEFHGKTMESSIGSDFDGDFEALVGPYLKASGLAPVTLKAQKSRLKKLYAIFRKSNTSTPPEERHFDEVLCEALTGVKNGQSLLMAIVGIRRSTAGKWMKGRSHPEKKYLPGIAKLETELGLPPGKLTSRVFQGPCLKRERGLYATGDYQRKISQKGYRFQRAKWTPEQLSVWSDYVCEKTQSPLTIDNPVSAQSGWRNERPGKGTIEVEQRNIEGYLGYVIRFGRATNTGQIELVTVQEEIKLEKIDPEEENSATPKTAALSLDPSLVSLGLFSDAGKVARYLEFRKRRARKECFTNETLKVLQLTLSLLAPGTGFVWKNCARFAHHPHFAGKLPKRTSLDSGRDVELVTVEEQWREWCRANHEKLRRVRKQLRAGNHIEKSRDPADLIQKILDQPRPWDILFQMEPPMWREPIPKTWSDKVRALEFVVRLLISFLIRYPFRIGTLERILVSDFHKTKEGYRLCLPHKRFKNHRFLKKVYKVDLPPFLADQVQRYLDFYRPILCGPHPSSHFFVLGNSMSVSPTPEKREHFEDRVSEAVQVFTRHYLKEWVRYGFRAQSVRDIVATHLILEDPLNGWIRAAMALWDSVATIRSHYSHLENAELLRLHAAEIEKISIRFPVQPSLGLR